MQLVKDFFLGKTENVPSLPGMKVQFSIDDLFDWVTTREPSFAIEGLPFAVYSIGRAQTLGWALSRSLR